MWIGACTVLEKLENNEFVLLMDEVFFQAGGSVPVAWDRIGSTEKSFMMSEIRHCMSDPRYYMENYHTIRTEQDGLKTMSPFWDSQELFYEEVMKLYRKNGKILAQKRKRGRPPKHPRPAIELTA